MTALPPLSSAGSPPQPPPLSAVLTVIDAPAELAALPVGARITGTVISAGAGKGAIAIETPLGILSGHSAVPWQKDASVSLRVQTVAPVMVLRITSATISPGAPIPATTAGRHIRTVTAAPGENHAASATPARTAATAGTSSARIEAIVLRPFSAVPSAPIEGSAAVLGTSEQPEARALFPAGTRLSVRLLLATGLASAGTPASAGGSSPSPAHARIGTTISARLVGTDGAGRPLLTSSAGPLLLATPVHFPPQWRGELEILTLQAPEVVDPLAKLNEFGGTRSSPDWQTLDEILGVLGQDNPQAAAHLRETGLPQPTSSLAASLLKVLGHLRRGDVRGWLGEEACEALARSRPDLLERLGTEMRRLAPRADAVSSGEWRIFSIPLVADGALSAITMLVRRQPQPDQTGGAEDGESTRFVLDLTLSRLGRIQIDGLLQAQGKQLDLIVRTDGPLAGDMQSGIRRILAEANSETGLRAAVCFRAAPGDFLDTAAPADCPGPPKKSVIV